MAAFPPILPSLSGLWFWDDSQKMQETESPKPLPRGAQVREESPLHRQGLGAISGIPWPWALRKLRQHSAHTPRDKLGLSFFSADFHAPHQHLRQPEL